MASMGTDSMTMRIPDDASSISPSGKLAISYSLHHLHYFKQRYAFMILLRILDGHYWYTRNFTVSISVSGTVFLALSSIHHIIEEALADDDSTGSSFKMIFIRTLLLLFLDLLTPFLMIKAITRTELRWWKGTTWIPVVRRTAATHKERASMRLDRQTKWYVKNAVSCVIFNYYHHPLI
jgi:hypothetical protein